MGLLAVEESPRWLAQKGRHDEALANLAFFRGVDANDAEVLEELAEIEIAVSEERANHRGLKEAFLGKGNFIRFVIAFTILCVSSSRRLIHF